MTKSMADRAVSLLGRGWSVIPVHVPIGFDDCSCGQECSWPGKHPRVPWRDYTEAPASERQVREWFDDEFYGSNLGVVTGRVSDLVVVDVDGGIEQFRQLDLPETLASRTGGGGFHFFYKLAGSNVSSGIGVTPGIDIKGDGGFVVLPPSLHVSGDRYRWLWRRSPHTIRPDQLPERQARSDNGDGGWVSELLEGVSEGDRSIAAARLAGRYAQLGLSLTETVMLMDTWNSLNQPPISLRELGATIRSVYQRHELRQETEVNSLGELASILSDITGGGS